MRIDGRPFDAMLTVGPESRFGPAFYTYGLFALPGDKQEVGLLRWDDKGWAFFPSDPNNCGSLGLELLGSGEDEAIYLAHRCNTGSGPGSQESLLGKWDGTDFELVAPRFNQQGMAWSVGLLTEGEHERLVVGGDFVQLDGQTVNYVAVLRGSNWEPLGEGFDYFPLTLTTFDDGTGPALYAGGLFSRSGDTPIPSSVARWDGQAWQPVGDEIIFSVHDLLVVEEGGRLEPGLYAAGSSHEVIGVARWDGANWIQVGAIESGTVRNIAVVNLDGSGDSLVATGHFASSDTWPTFHIAMRWDGSTWTEMGFPVPQTGSGQYGYSVGAFLGTESSPPMVFLGGRFDTSPSNYRNFAAFRGCLAASCGADINGDGVVNFTDLNAVLANFGNAGSGLSGDVNGDGVVNVEDLNAVLADFGAEC